VASARQLLTPRKDTVSSPKSPESLKDTLTVAAFRLVGPRLWDRLYILLSSFQSFLGHLHTQLAKGRGSVTLGPSGEFHSGSYRRNKRTLARTEGIGKLQATRPWVDSQDLEIFLMGFDMGEQWASDTLGKTLYPGQLEHASVALSTDAPLYPISKG
jgi:hypothetical protein